MAGAEKKLLEYQTKISELINDDYIHRRIDDPAYSKNTFQEDINKRNFADLKRLELLMKIEIYFIMYIYKYKILNASTMDKYLEFFRPVIEFKFYAIEQPPTVEEAAPRAALEAAEAAREAREARAAAAATLKGPARRAAEATAQAQARAQAKAQAAAAAAAAAPADETDEQRAARTLGNGSDGGGIFGGATKPANDNSYFGSIIFTISKDNTLPDPDPKDKNCVIPFKSIKSLISDAINYDALAQLLCKEKYKINDLEFSLKVEYESNNNQFIVTWFSAQILSNDPRIIGKLENIQVAPPVNVYFGLQINSCYLNIKLDNNIEIPDNNLNTEFYNNNDYCDLGIIGSKIIKDKYNFFIGGGKNNNLLISNLLDLIPDYITETPTNNVTHDAFFTQSNLNNVPIYFAYDRKEAIINNFPISYRQNFSINDTKMYDFIISYINRDSRLSIISLFKAISDSLPSTLAEITRLLINIKIYDIYNKKIIKFKNTSSDYIEILKPFFNNKWNWDKQKFDDDKDKKLTFPKINEDPTIIDLQDNGRKIFCDIEAYILLYYRSRAIIASAYIDTGNNKYLDLLSYIEYLLDRDDVNAGKLAISVLNNLYDSIADVIKITEIPTLNDIYKKDESERITEKNVLSEEDGYGDKNTLKDIIKKLKDSNFISQIKTNATNLESVKRIITENEKTLKDCFGDNFEKYIKIKGSLNKEKINTLIEAIKDSDSKYESSFRGLLDTSYTLSGLVDGLLQNIKAFPNIAVAKELASPEGLKSAQFRAKLQTLYDTIKEIHLEFTKINNDDFKTRFKTDITKLDDLLHQGIVKLSVNIPFIITIIEKIINPQPALIPALDDGVVEEYTTKFSIIQNLNSDINRNGGYEEAAKSILPYIINTAGNPKRRVTFADADATGGADPADPIDTQILENANRAADETLLVLINGIMGNCEFNSSNAIQLWESLKSFAPKYNYTTEINKIIVEIKKLEGFCKEINKDNSQLDIDYEKAVKEYNNNFNKLENIIIEICKKKKKILECYKKLLENYKKLLKSELVEATKNPESTQLITFDEKPKVKLPDRFQLNEIDCGVNANYLRELFKFQKWLTETGYVIKIDESDNIENYAAKLLQLYFKTAFPDHYNNPLKKLPISIKGLLNPVDLITDYLDIDTSEIVDAFKGNLLLSEEEKARNPSAYQRVKKLKKAWDKEHKELKYSEKMFVNDLATLASMMPGENPAAIKEILAEIRNNFAYNRLPYEIKYDPKNPQIRQSVTVGGTPPDYNNLLTRIQLLENRILEQEGGADAIKATASEPIGKNTDENKLMENAQKSMEKIDVINKNIRLFNETISNIKTTYDNTYISLIDNGGELDTNLKKYERKEETINEGLIIAASKQLESSKEWFKNTDDELSKMKTLLTEIYKQLLELLQIQPQNTIIKTNIITIKTLFDGKFEKSSDCEDEEYYKGKGLLFTIEKIKTKLKDNYEKYRNKSKSIAEVIEKAKKDQIEKERYGRYNRDRDDLSLDRLLRRTNGGNPESKSKECIDGNKLSLSQLFKLIQDSLFEETKQILTTITDKNKNGANPLYAATANEPSLFSILYNKYVDEKNKSGNLIATNNFIKSLDANSLLPANVLQITSRDKIIFVFITLFIRIITIGLVEAMITKNLIKNITFSLLAYFVFYTILFGIAVALINFDTYRMRIIFNYLNLNSNKSGIITHIGSLFVLSFLIFFMNTRLDPNLMKQPPNDLSDQDKIALMYKFEIISLIIWIFLLTITLIQ